MAATLFQEVRGVIRVAEGSPNQRHPVPGDRGEVDRHELGGTKRIEWNLQDTVDGGADISHESLPERGRRRIALTQTLEEGPTASYWRFASSSSFRGAFSDATLGLNEVKNARGEPAGVEELRPSETALVDSLLSDEDSELGRAMFRLTSVTTHSTFYAIQRNLEGRARGDRRVAVVVFNAHDGLNLVAGTLIGLCRAVDREVELYGWESAGWRDWRNKALGRVKALLREIQDAAEPG